MSKFIAVEDCVISTLEVVGGSFTIETEPSTHCHVNNKGIYSGPLSISFKGGSQPPTITAISASGTLNPTATKVKAERKAVVLEGDEVTMTGEGTDSSSGSKVPVVFKASVSSAGQTKVKGV